MYVKPCKSCRIGNVTTRRWCILRNNSVDCGTVWHLPCATVAFTSGRFLKTSYHGDAETARHETARNELAEQMQGWKLRDMAKYWNFYRAAWNADAVLRWEFCPSVCPSVRLSVCPSARPSVKRVHCDKTKEKSVQIFTPYERSFILVFWEEEWLVGDDPFYLKFWVDRPALERNRRFWTDNRS